MLEVKVPKVILMTMGNRNEFIIEVNLSEYKEIIKTYTDCYLLIQLTIPVLINSQSEKIHIEGQFIKKIKEINGDTYRVKDLKLYWPGIVDETKLEELRGEAQVLCYQVNSHIQ